MKSPTTREILRSLWQLRQDCNLAQDQTLARPDNAYGDITNAIMKVMATAGWGQQMAAEAMDFALSSNVDIVDAMIAVQERRGESRGS